MKKKNFVGVNVGSSSILLIFIVLCLVSLGVLSLTSSSADLRLSQKVADREKAYYDACNTAEHQLATLDAQFKEKHNSLSQEEFYSSLDNTYTYIYAITDIQSLVVTLKPEYECTEQGYYYSITGWQTVISSELDYDQTLHVYQ